MARRLHARPPALSPSWLASLVVVVAALFATPVAAVVIASPDGSINTTAPANDPGFANVGKIGGLSGVYLGFGYVLTANHVGTGTIVLDGISYPPISGSGIRLQNPDNTYADLRVFALALPHPSLPALTLSSATPLLGTPLVLIGQGRDRGPATNWSPPGGGAPIQGYELAGTRTIRWGENFVEAVPVDPVLGTFAFACVFDLTGPSATYEAQNVRGDSGGAAFVWDAGAWKLAGILYAAGLYQGQTIDYALDDNISYLADLSVYGPDIDAIIAAPEPDGSRLLLAGLVALSILATRRRVTGSVTGG